MKDGATKSFQQSYNCPAAVDEKAQIIVAAAVTQEPNDKQQVKPVVEEINSRVVDRKEWSVPFPKEP